GHWGDCTMDIGFFLSHLLLKALFRAEKCESYFELTQAFWRGYEPTVRWHPVAELQKAGIGHLAVCLLARVDGTSPAPYLTDTKQKEIARYLGRTILSKNLATWEEVLAQVRDAIQG